MELSSSVNRQQSSPNFGMALNIAKKAEPFIESLTTEERQYLNQLGKKIKGSRNDINIDEFGKVSLTYRPKPSDIRLVSDANREAYEAEMKAKNKKFNKEMTAGEKFDLILDGVKTLAKTLRIRMSGGKSKFMKDVQINEEFQKQCDRADAMQERIAERIRLKDAAASEETKSLLSEYGEK